MYGNITCGVLHFGDNNLRNGKGSVVDDCRILIGNCLCRVEWHPLRTRTTTETFYTFLFKHFSYTVFEKSASNGSHVALSDHLLNFLLVLDSFLCVKAPLNPNQPSWCLMQEENTTKQVGNELSGAPMKRHYDQSPSSVISSSPDLRHDSATAAAAAAAAAASAAAAATRLHYAGDGKKWTESEVGLNLSPL